MAEKSVYGKGCLHSNCSSVRFWLDSVSLCITVLREEIMLLSALCTYSVSLKMGRKKPHENIKRKH